MRGRTRHGTAPGRWRSLPGSWRRLGVAAGALLLLPFAVALSGPSASAATTPGRAFMVSIAPAARIPLGTIALGPVSGRVVETAEVSLKPRDDAAVTGFVAAVTNKNSATYHHYLSPGQYRSRFGPTSSSIAAVESVLHSDGLQVGSVSSDGLMITFKGTVAHIDSAFATHLESYRLPDGALGTGTTSAIRLPSTIASVVSGVVGLDNLAVEQPQYVRAASHSVKTVAAKAPKFAHPAGSPTPCAAATTAAETEGGLTDDAIAHAYGAFGLYDAGDFGAGQHIAVYELQPFLRSDIKTFDTCYFGGTAATAMGNRLTVVPVDGGDLQPSTGSENDEATLDVEDVSAMAPQADISVYEAPNTTFGGIDEYTQIVDTDSAQVVTSSWAVCEQLAQLAEPGLQEQENYLFQQAAAQGQTVLNAAGDTGDDSCNEYRLVPPPSGQNLLSELDPASQPYVVSVGGTTIDDATQPPSEHVWNDGASWGGGGGGISETWTMPDWQRTVTDTAANAADVTHAESVETANSAMESPFATPTFCDGTLGLSTGTPCRETPDVTAQADEFTGAVTIFGISLGYGPPNGWTTIGGTSSATPIWAAMLALVNASHSCLADTVTFDEGGTPTLVPDAGFASPILYGIAGNATAYAASFNDIKSGNNDIYGLDNGLVFPARAGYDMASGLGSPQLTTPSGTNAALAFYMCTYGAPLSAPPAVTGLSPLSGTTAGGEVVTVTGTGFGTAGTPLVKSVQVGGGQATSFAVVSNTSLTVTLPAADTTIPGNSVDPTQDGAGEAQIVVTATDGESSSPNLDSVFEYVDEAAGPVTVPTVTGVSPYGGLQTAPATVTIFGSGFSTTPSDNTVDFGGAAATVTNASAFALTVKPPDFSALTPGTACPVDDGASGASLNPTDDVCQVEVTVEVGGHTSGTVAPLKPYEGILSFDNMGAEVLPPACGCEDEPQPDEYDYVPLPTITGTSTTNAATLASEFGGSTTNLVTVTGTGLDPLTLEYALLGFTSTFVPNENSIFYPIEEAGTSMVLDAPAIASMPTLTSEDLFVKAASLAGTSTSSGDIIYAGVPVVTAVVNTATHKNGVPDSQSCASPTTGCGTPITITGTGFFTTHGVSTNPGFSEVTGPLGFEDDITGFSLGTQYNYTVTSNTKISTRAVQQNPALVDVLACSNSGCAINPPADELYIYPPGNPSITAVSPSSGPAHGSNKVVITGSNLGCVKEVKFGSTVALTAANAPALLYCGETGEVIATAPPGKVGSVKVTIVTEESYFTGSTSNSLTYTYKASTPAAPLDVTAKAGKNTATVTWKAPAFDGGSAVTAYVVKAIPKTGASISVTVTAKTFKLTFNGLKAHVAYTLVVEAKNKLGVGLAGTSKAVTPT